jgi:hypothetical protein
MAGASCRIELLPLSRLVPYGNPANYLGTLLDSGPKASPNQTEYDLTADYRFKEGPTRNLRMRVRAALIDQDEAAGGDDFLDFRVIVNWDFATSP